MSNSKNSHSEKRRQSWFFSSKNKRKFWCRSHYMSDLLRILENDDRVLKFKTEKKIKDAPYEYRNARCWSQADVVVNYVNGNVRYIVITSMERIKRTHCKNATKRIVTLKKYCDENGILFSVWTDLDALVYRAMENGILSRAQDENKHSSR